MKLVIENIRSFAGRHEYDVRPLTILVGENSSGKSTFLAVLSAISDAVSFPGIAALNKPPYDLGTYDTIATYKGGRGGRAKTFSFGYKRAAPRGGPELCVVATFGADEGEARIRNLTLNEGDVKAKLTWLRDRIGIRIEGLDTAEPIESGIPGDIQQLSSLTFRSLVSFISSAAFRGPQAERDPNLGMSLYERLEPLADRWARSAPRATSIAPIRSEPKRTYDRLSEEYDPSGDHVPYILARVLLQKDTTKSKQLHDALVAFGKDSGLFRNISVKRLGTKSGDPFQVQITVGGPSVNLSDVGYGVSQSLPIAVESILRATNARILLQQPEVHLHPRAQAALGSFFAKLVAHEERQFVIETHSDYLIDRVRQEVAAGTLPPHAVRILFFDRPHIETTVTELTLDMYGNIENAPANYRAFFLEEELRLLSRADEASDAT